MRLLNAETLRFKTFFSDDQTPPYAILSHTWGDEEVSYQDMMYEEVIDNLSPGFGDTSFQAAVTVAASIQFSKVGGIPTKQRRGYQKIIETAKIAKQKHLDYFWVDTCCIDKTSSAELQEAINSMWRWYRTSAYCAVYLEDSKDSSSNRVNGKIGKLRRKYGWLAVNLRQSRWITRGWTLQELIAPRNVWFYDCNWLPTFDKLSGLDVIEEITKIPKQVLSTSDLSMSSVAQKMSWAANRKTTRIEDAAYSLMGLFDVHMPMLYGEGDNAFRRLQEQIIKTDPDDSILDWGGKHSFLRDGSKVTIRGALAKSPRDFEHSYDVRKGDNSLVSLELEANGFLRLRGHHISCSNKHGGDIRIELTAHKTQNRNPVVLAGLTSPSPQTTGETERGVQCIGIYAERGPFLAKSKAYMFGKFVPEIRLLEIRLPLKPTIPWYLPINEKFVSHIHFQRAMSESIVPEFTISPVRGAGEWDASERTMHTQKAFGYDSSYVGVFLLSPQGPDSLWHESLNMVIGYDHEQRTSWWACDLPESIEWPTPWDSFKMWEDVIRLAGWNKQRPSADLVDGVVTCKYKDLSCISSVHPHPFRCQLSPGVWQDKLSIIVSIEGLVTHGTGKPGKPQTSMLWDSPAEEN